MSEQGKGRHRQSKAALCVDLQTQNRAVCEHIQSFCDTAVTLLDSEKPTKRARKDLLDTAQSLLSLQNGIDEKIPALVLSCCTKYSQNRLHAVNNHQTKTFSNVCAPRDNMRSRTFEIGGDSFPLPNNKVQFTAVEACEILVQIEDAKTMSIKKSISRMINFKSSASEGAHSLIPCGLSTMYSIYKKYKINPDVEWSRIGRPPILDITSFLTKVAKFEKDEGRAIGKKDLKNILKGGKEDAARIRGNSTLIVVTPTKCTQNNYFSLLPMLDATRTKSSNVQQTSEARYIAIRSFRNVVSHIMSIAVSHYQIGKPDSRLKKIDKASEGAKLLYKLIQKVNNGEDLKVVYPMFISTTDDTTVFTFEGSVDGKENDCFIINTENDSGTYSSYNKDTSSTDSCRGIRIRHSVTFNAVGNAAPMYATVYGLTEEELPTATCPSGVYTLPIKGFCYGGSQDCANKQEGYLVFLRNTSKQDVISTDQLNHIKYRNEVFLPYIKSTREHYLQRERWMGGDEIEDDNIWVGWQVSFELLLY